MAGVETQRIISRRALSKAAPVAVGAGILSAADLAYRGLVNPVIQDKQHLEQYTKLKAEAESLYPRSSDAPRVYNPQFIAKLKETPLFTGYDENGSAVYLSYLEGDALADAYRTAVQHVNIDTPHPGLSGYNRDGSITTKKPDGSLWTIRERLNERPDIYNVVMRNVVAGRLQEEYISERMPKRETHDYLRDKLNLGLIATGAFSLAAKWVIKKRMEYERAEQDEVRQRNAAWEEYGREKAEREARWQERVYEQRERKQARQEEARRQWERRGDAPGEETVQARLSAFFRLTKIDLAILKDVPPRQREIIVRQLRKGAALIFTNADLELWKAINHALDTVDPKFDKTTPNPNAGQTKDPDVEKSSASKNQDSNGREITIL